MFSWTFKNTTLDDYFFYQVFWANLQTTGRNATVQRIVTLEHK